MERDGEAPEIEIRGVKAFPHSKLEDALRANYHCQEHFDERFTIRLLGEGYICASNSTATDARGYLASLDSPLPDQREAFKAILHLQIYYIHGPSPRMKEFIGPIQPY